MALVTHGSSNIMEAYTKPEKHGIVFVKFPEEEGGWSKAQIKQSVAAGSPDLERGTHFVHFDGEEFLQVANLVEGRYGSADGAGYLSWVMLGRAGGRRRRV